MCNPSKIFHVKYFALENFRFYGTNDNGMLSLQEVDKVFKRFVEWRACTEGFVVTSDPICSCSSTGQNIISNGIYVFEVSKSKQIFTRIFKVKIYPSQTAKYIL